MDDPTVCKQYLQLIRQKAEALHDGREQDARRCEDLLDDLYRSCGSPILKMLRDPRTAPK